MIVLEMLSLPRQKIHRVLQKRNSGSTKSELPKSDVKVIYRSGLQKTYDYLPKDSPLLPKPPPKRKRVKFEPGIKTEIETDGPLKIINAVCLNV